MNIYIHIYDKPTDHCDPGSCQGLTGISTATIPGQPSQAHFPHSMQCSASCFYIHPFMLTMTKNIHMSYVSYKSLVHHYKQELRMYLFSNMNITIINEFRLKQTNKLSKSVNNAISKCQCAKYTYKV